MPVEDVIKSWFMSLITTSAIVIITLFLIIPQILNSLEQYETMAASIPLFTAVIAFLYTIWRSFKGLGNLIYAMRRRLDIYKYTRRPALVSERSFLIGLILMLIGICLYVILSIF